MSQFKQFLKDDVIDKESGLSDKETFFLDILFDKHKGNFISAMKEAGFSESDSRKVRAKLSKEIQKVSKEYLESETSRAAVSLSQVLEDPTQPGSKLLISAAKEVLDRGGVVKEDVLPTVSDNILVILPPKQTQSDDEE